MWWAEQGQGTASVSKLLATPPAHAKLYRYTIMTTSGAAMAVTSKPTGHNNNFTVTTSNTEGGTPRHGPRQARPPLLPWVDLRN